MPLFRTSSWLLVAAWGLVGLGAALLVAGYERLPDAIVLYRPPWAEAPTTGARSLVTVGRVALMGVGQLGAATAMVCAAHGAQGWQRFWRWLGLVAGVKTLLECLDLATPPGSLVGSALTLTTLAVVAGFLVAALIWWRRGELRSHPPLAGAPRAWLAASLALWLACAAVPQLQTSWARAGA